MITANQLKDLARACGFALAGVAAARPLDDFSRFEAWRAAGFAGEMTYLTDRRGDLRSDPRHLLPDAQSILCVGKLYNTAEPHTAESADPESAWISRYAWGDDYHQVVRRGLEQVVEKIKALHPEPFSWRSCVDTAPLLERSYARAAGLGWIGRNTCLINQEQGSWFFLGELLLSIPLSADLPAPARCGTCRRCIDACPTAAIVPNPDGDWTIDARACISYLTIEKRGPLPGDLTPRLSNHVFGCDICQDVCPWNKRAPSNADGEFSPRLPTLSLEQLALLSRDEFQSRFRHSPVERTKYSGFLRNIAIAMGNAQNERMRAPLEVLALNADPVVAAAADQALRLLAAEADVPLSPSSD